MAISAEWSSHRAPCSCQKTSVARVLKAPLFDADVSTGGRSFSMQKGGRMPMTIGVSADVQPQAQERVRQLGA